MKTNYFQRAGEYFRRVIEDIRTNGLIQYPNTMSVEEIAEAMKPEKNPRPPSKGLVQFADNVALILKREKSYK